MLLGGRENFNCKKDGSSAAVTDYVQDGLYLHLDGIENCGIGTHNASAKSWVDVSGNNKTATFLNSTQGFVWGEDHLKIYGKTYKNILKIPGLSSMNNFTFEMVFQGHAMDAAGRLFDVEKYTNNLTTRRFTACAGLSFPLVLQICVTGNVFFSDVPQCYEMLSPMTLAIFPSASGSNITAANAYVDGGKIKQSNTYSKGFSTPSPYIDIANRSTDSSQGLDMDLYSLRIYSKVLTDKEIAANAAIDRKRFAFGD